jgi:hypothetical protein
MLLGLAFAATLLLWLRVAHLTPDIRGFAKVGDHHVYIYMATHGVFGFHIAPYAGEC